MSEIRAYDETRRTNAQAIVDAMFLGWVESPCVDLTFGLGRFWRYARPETLVRCDLDPERALDVCCDFRFTPFASGSFATVVFDPPYKLNGTGGSTSSDADYGVADRWDDRRDLYADGMAEAARICRPGGTVLVKGQTQIAGGRIHSFERHAIPLGERHQLRPIGILAVVSNGQPQPKGRPQRSPRNNTSALIAFRTPVRRRLTAGAAA